jgi:hypothetical protein
MAAPFSGASRELGRQMKIGIETAFSQINDAGGVNGRLLRLMTDDDGYEPTRTADVMKSLYDKDQVFGFDQAPLQPPELCAAIVIEIGSEVSDQRDDEPVEPGIGTRTASEIEPDVTRVTLHGGVCPCCAKRFKAERPQGLGPGSPFGPNLRAFVIIRARTGTSRAERAVRPRSRLAKARWSMFRATAASPSPRRRA